MRNSLFSGVLAVAITSTVANAAVKYEFTALSTFASGPYTSVSGSFTYIAPDFITSNATVPLADLSSCSASNSVLGPLSCGDQSFAFDVFPPDVTIEFGVTGPATTSFDYYFNSTAFSTIGTHDTVLFGTDQAAELIVSQVAGAVPEMPTWALLVMGFGGLAGVMSLRRHGKRALEAA